jgi:hypothetical protein
LPYERSDLKLAAALLTTHYKAEGRLPPINAITMKQYLARIALVVDSYDDAIDFYVRKLKFELVEDTYQPEQDKRWVVVRPPGSDNGAALLLAEGRGEKQRDFIGNQAGGRVFLFLFTDDFERDYANARLKTSPTAALPSSPTCTATCGTWSNLAKRLYSSRLRSPSSGFICATPPPSKTFFDINPQHGIEKTTAGSRNDQA